MITRIIDDLLQSNVKFTGMISLTVIPSSQHRKIKHHLCLGTLKNYFQL